MTVFTASEPQSNFLRSNARIAGFIGGIGSGKTAAGAVKAILRIDGGNNGIMVAPDFPHFAKSTWPVFKEWVNWDNVANGHLNHPHTKAKELIFRTPHGLVTVYYGGIDDPESWTGPTVNWFWFDEGRRKKKRDAFNILIGRIRTGQYPQGFVTTSPRGINHWIHEVFVEQKFPQDVRDAFEETGVPLVEYFQSHTDDNIHNDPLYVASLRAMYTGKHALQELGGEFVVMEGAVYEQFGDENVSYDADYIPGAPVELAIDDGFTEGHPRVILLIQVVPPFINVFAELVSLYELPEVSIENLLALPYSLPTTAYIDSSAAELARRVWDADIDTVRATHRVEEGIKHTRPFICDANNVRRVRFHPRCEFSIAEIKSYTYPERTTVARMGSGQPRPLKENDNAADALRYYLWFKQLDDVAGMRTISQTTDADAQVESLLTEQEWQEWQQEHPQYIQPPQPGRHDNWAARRARRTRRNNMIGGTLVDLPIRQIRPPVQYRPSLSTPRIRVRR